MSECKTCKFFKVIPQSTANGICLRNPPQIAMVQNTTTGMFSTETIFPVIGISNWCGEYIVKLREVERENGAEL